MRVVTYQTPTGDRLNICPACERAYTDDETWPTNRRGDEYCTVSRGTHDGACDTHHVHHPEARTREPDDQGEEAPYWYT